MPQLTGVHTLLATALLVGQSAACPSTSDCVRCTQSTYRCGFAWTSKCYCEMESCGSCDTGSSGDGDRSPDADGRCTGSCAPPPPPDPCATNDGGCNGVPLYADTHCVNVNWVADCQCNAGFQSVRSSGQDVCIPVDAGTLSCQDMQHFAEVVNRVCPAAGAGQNVPASCPELCGTVFTAWWRNCHNSVAAKGVDGNGQFSAFYSACLCEGVNCGAGGTCHEGHCVCTEGWNGEHCADVDECTANNGGCNHAPCANSAGSSSCGGCMTGWAGDHCDLDIDECEDTNGGCGNALCHNSAGTHRCGHDSCLSTPCKHAGAECVNTGDDSYACSCATDHWAGENCEEDVDECAVLNGGCGTALCHDTPGHGRCGSDNCESTPCQHDAMCTNVADEMYACNCAVGWEGENCADDVDNCVHQKKDLVGDQHGGGCGAALCHNPPGAATARCGRDSCASSPCQNGGDCTNVADDAYSCSCPCGFIGENCEQAIDGCTSAPCRHGACITGCHGAWSCICEVNDRSGKDTWKGEQCNIDVDECADGLDGCAPPEPNCRNLPGGFECKHCPPIEVTHGTAKECAICACAGNEGDHCIYDARTACDPGFQAAYDSPSDLNLACGAGFDWDGTPIRCNDIDECASAPCLNGGACEESATPGVGVAVLVYSCRCPTGFAGGNCETMVDLACEDSACGHGRCGTAGRCACEAGWGGPRCDQNDPCDAALIVCTAGQGICSDGRCICESGWGGELCETDIDECVTKGFECSDPTPNCRNTPGGYECVACPPVMVAHGTPIDSPRNSCAGNDGDHCIFSPRGACEDGYEAKSNTRSDFSLSCRDGAWSGTPIRCENVDDCASRPCLNTGACADGMHSYSCTCIDTWAGENCADAPSNLPCGGGGDCGPNLCAAKNGGCDTLTSCTLAFGGRQCGECPYPMYRTTFSGDGASVCVDVDECDTKPCWQSGSAAAECLNTLGAYSCGACPAGFKQELGVDQGHGCIPVGGAAGH